MNKTLAPAGPESWDELGWDGFQAAFMEALGWSTPSELQIRALHTTGISLGRSVLCSAPTGTGKTGVGMLAISRALCLHQTALIAVPTRALAEEYGRKLELALKNLNSRRTGPSVRLAITTGDHHQWDSAIRAGRCNLVVGIYEKLRALTNQSPEILRRTGCVVLDEIHILSEPRRGALVDCWITRFLRDFSSVQLVGLTTPQDGLGRLARWMGAELLSESRRPVSLRLGTLALEDGWFRYRESSPGSDLALERLLPSAPVSGKIDSSGALKNAELELALLSAINTLTQRWRNDGQSTLVFVPTRRLARQWAWYLAESLQNLPNHASVSPLPLSPPSEDEEDHGYQLLTTMAQAGIGFHGADLSTSLRRAVETAFRDKHLSVLVTTSTLAEGVNLQADQVLIVPPASLGWKGHSGGLDRRRLEAMAGRAGRCLGNHCPRAVVLCPDGPSAQEVHQDLLDAPRPKLSSPSDDADWELLALDAFQGVGPLTRDQATQRIFETWTFDKPLQQQAEPCPRLQRVFERLESWELLHCLTEDDSGCGYKLSPSGKVALRHGLSLPGTVWMAGILPCWAQHDRPGPSQDLALLLTAATMLRPDDAPGLSPRPSSPLTLSVIEDIQRLSPWLPSCLDSLLDPHRDHPTDELLILYRAALALGWTLGEPVLDLETRFGLLSGGIHSLAATLATALEAMAELAASQPQSAFPILPARSLARRLPEGLPIPALGLVGWTNLGLSRSEILNLAREGYCNAEALEGVSHQELTRWIRPELAERLLQHLALQRARLERTPRARHGHTAPLSPSYQRHQNLPLPPAPSVSPPSAARSSHRQLSSALQNPPQPPSVEFPAPEQLPRLTIDLHQAGLVRYGSACQALSPLAFQLLLLLALQPRQLVSYSTIRQTLWPGTKVGDQQVRFHKRRLALTLQQLGLPEAIETRHSFGLVLDLDSDQVLVLHQEDSCNSRPVPGEYPSESAPTPQDQARVLG